MNSIKEILEEKGIKQTWLEEKFNMVNNYVQNRQQLTLGVLADIA